MWAMQRTPLVVVLLILASWCVAAPVSAQHVELGGFATFIDMDNVDQAPWGGGGRFGVEILPFATLEAEVGVFPGEQRVTGPFTQVLGGVKLGGRARGYGLFAKLRPGFVRFEDDFIAPGVACIAVVPTPEACLADRLNFALDFGSVVEIYPSDRLIIRVDIGTTNIWYGTRGEDGSSRNAGNFQLSLGGGVRF
jgi:hypothetical protein